MTEKENNKQDNAVMKDEIKESIDAVTEKEWKKEAEFPRTAVVACQGAQGAYSQIAANALFDSPDIVYMRTFDGVFRAVENELCEYGVLPLENSNAGSVSEVYDLMKQHHFSIVRSAKVTISHVLLAKERVAVEEIKEIYTHEQAVKQCSRFLEQHPHLKINISPNTAKAAQFVSERNQKDIAAIASAQCAGLYQLNPIANNVQNHANNFTRFICISKERLVYDGADKISLMLTLEHKPGALYEVMKRFAVAGLNLTKLESRPIPDSDFEFMFYFDVSADIENAEVCRMLKDLNDCVLQLVVLGNYSEIFCTGAL